MNGGWGEVLNFPYKPGESPGGCCSFFQPTQDFVNSFRTGPDGLPYLDNYNEESVSSDIGIPPSKPWDLAINYRMNDLVTRYDPADPYTDRQYHSLNGTPETPNVGNDPLTSPAEWAFNSVVYMHYADRLGSAT